MNDTNRALNRTLLLLIGLLLLALGASAVVTVTVPAAAGIWRTGADAARAWIGDAVAATAIPGATLSWFAIGVLAVILVVIVLLVVALAGSVAGRRSRTVLRGSGAQNPLGRVTVTESFASDALKHSLDGRSEVLSSSVTANDIRRQPVIHVSVTPRQNTSPHDLAADVDGLLTNLATLTDQALPAYISIHSGLRARLAHDQRRLS